MSYQLIDIGDDYSIVGGNEEEVMNKFPNILGIVLLLMGIILLLSNFGFIEISWKHLWPLFLLVPGILFEFGFFIYRKDAGLLVPGGILTTYGLLFLANTIYGWQLMGYLWPVFLLGVAIGLFQLYLFGERENGLLIPVGILTALSLFFLITHLVNINFKIIAGIIFIFIGLGIILKQVKSK